MEKSQQNSFQTWTKAISDFGLICAEEARLWAKFAQIEQNFPKLDNEIMHQSEVQTSDADLIDNEKALDESLHHIPSLEYDFAANQSVEAQSVDAELNDHSLALDESLRHIRSFEYDFAANQSAKDRAGEQRRKPIGRARRGAFLKAKKRIKKCALISLFVRKGKYEKAEKCCLSFNRISYNN